MATGWDRLESMARTVDLDGGLEARVADPLVEAGPAVAGGRVPRGRRSPARRRPDAPAAACRWPRSARPAPVARPSPSRRAGRWRPLVEVTPEPGFGSAHLHSSTRAGRRLTRLLRERGLGAAAEALRHRVPAGAAGAERRGG